MNNSSNIEEGSHFYLSGKQVVSLMRRHRVTIDELASRTGIAKDRIRQVREKGLRCLFTVIDWLEAITGEKVIGFSVENLHPARKWAMQMISPFKQS